MAAILRHLSIFYMEKLRMSDGETGDVSIVEILIELSKGHCKYGSM